MMMMTEQQKHDSVCAKYPWLVAECVEDDGTRGHNFYKIHDPMSHYRCRIPELLGKVIQGFFHGWVILSNNIMWSLWNPLTSQTIRLPPLNMFKDGDFEDNDIGECCLSSPPDCPGSVLLLTRTNKPNFVFCRLDRKRKKLKWTEMSYAKQLKKIAIDSGLLHNLTCCGGRVYALSTGGNIADFVIQIDINVVKDKEVVIKLVVFGGCPSRTLAFGVERLYNYNYFLKGSSTELLYLIIIEGTKETILAITLFKIDMAKIKWEELEVLKDWDLFNKKAEELVDEDIKDLQLTDVMWEEMSDLKDTAFFVDFDRGCCSIFFVATELGGYIHIRGGETNNVIYSYHVNYKTILPSTIPFPVLPTSHVFMWEYRLEDDFGEAKCIVDPKQEEEDEIVLRSVVTNDDDEVGFNKSCLLLNIPFDILEMISQFCVGVEYINFGATCKQCHLAAPLIQWRNKTSLRRLQTYSLDSPWLVVLDKNRGLNTFTDPMFGDHYLSKNPQISVIEASGIYCSRFGWLLVRVSDEILCLMFYNPFTNDKYKFPQSYLVFESLCFSAPPTSPNCMVVGFTKSRNLETRAYIFYAAQPPTPPQTEDLTSFGLIQPTWRMLELGNNISSIRFPTFHGGDLYALCNEGQVIVFKHLLEEDSSWKVIETKVPGEGAQYYMMTCDQHILLVIVGNFEKSVDVFKLNDSTQEWDKVYDLGRHMIYVSDTTCLCIDAQTPEMGNKIYFPCLHPASGKVVFYSLETCLFHTFNGRNMEQYSGGLFNTVHHHNTHAWIEPSWC